MMLRSLVVLCIVSSLALAQEKIPDTLKKAQAKLETTPDDVEANTTIGKYLIEKGDFEKGLPFVVKGSDATLKPIAEKDIAGAKDPAEMIKLGDLWLEIAEKKATLRSRCTDRAIFWFQKAWPFVDGKEKDSLRRIFYHIAGPPTGYEKPKKGVPVFAWDTADTIGSFLESAFAHTGKQSMKILPHLKKGEEAYTDSQQIPVLPGKKYVFSAWVYTDKTDSDGRMNIRVYDKANKVVVDKSYAVPQDSPFWQKVVSEEIELPAEAYRASVHFGTRATSGGTWIDDVAMVCDGKDYAKNGGFEDKK